MYIDLELNRRYICTSQEKNIGMTKAFQFFSRQFIESHVNATVKMPFQHHFTSYVYMSISRNTSRVLQAYPSQV